MDRNEDIPHTAHALSGFFNVHHAAVILGQQRRKIGAHVLKQAKGEIARDNRDDEHSEQDFTGTAVNRIHDANLQVVNHPHDAGTFLRCAH